MEAKDLFRLLRRNVLLFVLFVLVGINAGFAYCLVQTPMYQAESRAVVFPASTGSIADATQFSSFTQQAVLTLAGIVTKPIVLEPVITDMGLKTTSVKLAKRVSAQALTDQSQIVVTVLDPSPVRAQRIGDDLVRRLTDAVPAVVPHIAGKAAPLQVTSIQPAIASESPVTPNIPLTLALAFLASAAAAIVVAILREQLDTRIRSSADLPRVTDQPVVGRIPRRSGRTGSMVTGLGFAEREAYRSLRTNLDFIRATAAVDSVVVTSSVPNEGKTTTATNLAVALADADDEGQRVLLIDGDLRRPSVAGVLGLDGGVGLTDVLVGYVTSEQAIQQWGDTRLDVLPAGRSAPNPSELLQAAAMEELLNDLRTRYSVIVIDAPPVLAVTDAAVLSRRVSGVLMVCGAKRVRRAELTGALAALHQVQARLLGVVLNMIPPRGPDADPAVRQYAGYHSEQPAKPERKSIRLAERPQE